MKKLWKRLVRKPFKGAYACEWQLGSYIVQFKHDVSVPYTMGLWLWRIRVVQDPHWRW